MRLINFKKTESRILRELQEKLQEKGCLSMSFSSLYL